MNALMDNEGQYFELDDINRKKKNKTYFGDIFATAIVLFFVAFSLTISGWSAVLFVTGNVQEGGPLGHLFKFVYTLVNTPGIVS